MHGMLSLAVLVAAFAGLAGWVGYLLVRLYRACPAARSLPAQPLADSAPPHADSAEPTLAAIAAESTPADRLAADELAADELTAPDELAPDELAPDELAAAGELEDERVAPAQWVG